MNEVQVVLGLLIDSCGVPLGYELYPGNTSEFKTLEPALRKLKEDYGIKEVIIVADRGLNSKSNLAAIKSLGMDYVMAMKLRGASVDLKEKIFSDEGYEEQFSEDTGEMVYKFKVLDRTTVVTQVEEIEGEKVKEKVSLEEKLLITYSKKREKKDRKDRERLIRKAERLIASPGNYNAELKKGGKSFVKVSVGKDLKLDEEKIKEQSQFDGYYGIVTSKKELPASEVASIHHSLWKIEENFRVMKTGLEARPCFVWTDASVQVNFMICYLALVIQRLLEEELRRAGIKTTTEQILEAVRTASVAVLEDRGADIYMKTGANELFDRIGKVYDMEPLHTWNKKSQMKKRLKVKIA